ncbi:MAG: YicC/YloC family endoribonuclease [Bryobacteraceae bacterium]
MSRAPIRSMTGFARVRRVTPYGEIIVSLKSVNHRGLDLHFHLSPDLDAQENAIRAIIKRSVLRGHIDIRLSILRTRQAGAAAVNTALLNAWFQAFHFAAEELKIHSKPDVNSALRIPGMFSEPMESDFEADFEKELLSAAEEAVVLLNDFRKREGAEIYTELSGHNQRVQEAAGRMEDIRGRATTVLQARLNERLADMLRSVAMDPQRLAQEAAILADRSDIGEEIARLKIHANQLGVILEEGGEVGKRLDFLLQEMNREANTILSKTSGIGEVGLGMTDLALAAKSAIEKIREQALNLE